MVLTVLPSRIPLAPILAGAPPIFVCESLAAHHELKYFKRIQNPAIRRYLDRAKDESNPASCIFFLSEQAFAPQNTRFWIRRCVWFRSPDTESPSVRINHRCCRSTIVARAY